ncbi:MAG: energy transducer TonB [Acidobacteria bacterium]|nr:energy transducer TonB [Acidobacteriota bacterium]
MGKIVKYCNACEEGFAEKFGFCPNCGAHLTAFEMNPVASETKPEPIQSIEDIPVPEIISVAPINETVVESAPEEIVVEEPAIEAAEAFEFDDDVLDEEVMVTPEPAPTAAFVVPAATQSAYEATFQPKASPKIDDAFHITIVEEKNVKQRNLLLLGVFALFFGAFTIGLLYSLFNKFLDVAAIDSPDLISYVGEVEPIPFEEEQIIKKDKEKGGGGGGGGKEEETPASKGREAAQVENPQFAPSSRAVPLTNPDIEILLATKNKNPRAAENTDEPYGLRNGADGLSDGTGSGGGLGNGRGRGQGNGNGDGLGNGNGWGRGNGDGDGNGDGSGDGDGLFKDAKVKVGPTVGVKIISKPRPGYTDSARVNNIQGTVILKVTFLANGTIGGVSVVKGLPNGLTEQAIAAAKGIRFEPAKKGGSPYSVNKNVEYSFTIF